MGITHAVVGKGSRAGMTQLKSTILHLSQSLAITFLLSPEIGYSQAGCATQATLLRLNCWKSTRLPSGDSPACVEAGLGAPILKTRITIVEIHLFSYV